MSTPPFVPSSPSLLIAWFRYTQVFILSLRASVVWAVVMAATPKIPAKIIAPAKVAVGPAKGTAVLDESNPELESSTFEWADGSSYSCVQQRTRIEYTIRYSTNK